MMTWLWVLYFLTGRWVNHFQTKQLKTNAKTAKLNNLVKNIHFFSDIGYDFFLPKHLKVFLVKPESGDFNVLFGH